MTMERIDAVGARADAMPEAATPAPQKAGGPKGSFATLVDKTLTETERLQDAADGMVKSMAAGEITDVHQVMLAMNRADLSFRMMLEVRNKLLDAYQEVMRMQV
jgi:flagellar hook-basal body complex protein FliE